MVSDAKSGCDVCVGGFTLHVGDDAGIEIRAETGTVEDVELSQAVQREGEDKRKRTVGEIAEGASDDASQVTAKIERTRTLCTEVIGGEVSLESVGDELDALVSLLARLDREGRWEEELLLVRCTAKLLALTRRWLDLLNWLRAALRAAERLEDSSGKGWAMHELGTLHLAAGKHSDADCLLTRACDLRERCGERRGGALTERNLNVLCRTLRDGLHDKQRERLLDKVARRPIIALGAAAVLLAVGGGGGAVIARSHGKGGSTNSSYGPNSGGHSATREDPTSRFLVRPTSPLTEQQVSFDAGESSAGTGSIVGYEWDFGDGESATGRSALHAFAHAGPYRVKLTVTNSRGKTGTVVHIVNVAEGQGQTPKLRLSCPKSLPFGGAISIAGSLSPSQAETPVQLTVTAPTGERVHYKAVTSPEDTFEVKIKSSREGQWTVLAELEASGASKPTNDMCTFIVEPKETVPAVTTTTGEG